MRKNSCAVTNEILKVPPFRDSHIHFTVNGRPAPEAGLPGLRTSLMRSGIFSVADCGHKSARGFEAKRLFAGLPEVKTSGRALYKKGGYGAFLGLGVSGAAEIVREIRELADSGVDFVKVVNSGIVDPGFPGSVTPGGFAPEELHVIVEESARHGLIVRCHANSDAAICDAVRAGVNSIEHGFFVSGDTLLMMAEKGVSWTPTVFALHAFSLTQPDRERSFIEGVTDKHLDSIAYAASIGVALKVGTDSGSSNVKHGDSFREELKMFSAAGLSKEEIAAAACMEKEEVLRGNYLMVDVAFNVIEVWSGGKLLSERGT